MSKRRMDAGCTPEWLEMECRFRGTRSFRHTVTRAVQKLEAVLCDKENLPLDEFAKRLSATMNDVIWLMNATALFHRVLRHPIEYQAKRLAEQRAGDSETLDVLIDNLASVDKMIRGGFDHEFIGVVERPTKKRPPSRRRTGK